MNLAIVLVAAYVLGAIPTSYIVVYRFTGRDIRQMGSGNPGTMNVLDTVGWPAAVIVGVGDVTKGMAAVGLAYLAGLSDAEAVMAAVVAVIGHDYSVFLRLRGGNGTATAGGGMAALLFWQTMAAFGVGIAIWLVVGSRRVGGLIGLALIPSLAYWSNASNTLLIGVVILIAIAILKIVRFEGFTPHRVRSDH